jgi:hypothetical protein
MVGLRKRCRSSLKLFRERATTKTLDRDADVRPVEYPERLSIARRVRAQKRSMALAATFGILGLAAVATGWVVRRRGRFA